MAGEVVLIIDDSNALRSLLETVLPYGGYRTICAGTGEDGLRLVLEAQPDVILTDLELPDITGLQVLEELNGQGIAIPTVMMTAYGSEGVAAQALKLGVRDYLIAYNIDLETGKIDVAKQIAKKIREKNGGLKGVKALGISLDSKKQVQVSMNLVDPKIISPKKVMEAVEKEAKKLKVKIAGDELVGLMPEQVKEAARVF